MGNISTPSKFYPLLRTQLVPSYAPAQENTICAASDQRSAEIAYQFMVHPLKRSVYAAEQASSNIHNLQLPLLLHAEDTELIFELLGKEHEQLNAQPINLKARLQAIDGFSWISCDLIAYPLPLAYKELFGWHVIAYHTKPEDAFALERKGEQVLYILSQLYNAGLWRFYPADEQLEIDISLQKLLNLEKRRLSFQELQLYIHPEDVDHLLKKVFKLQRKGGLFQLNVRFKNPASKSYRFLTLSASAFANEQHSTSITGLCFDGTYQQRLQTKSLLNRAFLDEAQSLGKLGCFEWQPEINRLSATEQLKKLIGLAKEEDFTLEYLKNKLSAEDFTVLENAYANFLIGEDTQELTIQLRNAAGIEMHLWIRAKAHYSGGSMVSLIGIVQDVTERVSKQVQLKAKDRLIGGFLKNLPVCVFVINRKEKIVSVIGTGLKWCGFDRGKIIGKQASDVTPDFTQHLKKVFAGAPQSFLSEYTYEDQILNFFNYYYFDQERKQAIGFTLDITKQRRGELAEEHLNQLEQRYQLMDTFVHAVAHDLRSPVVNLDMLLNFFMEETSPANQQKYVEAMSTGIQHLKRTLDALIEILRIEKDSTIAAENISFEQLLAELEHEYGSKLTDVGGSLQTYLQCKDIVYNRAYLSSILRNLISNAIKYRYPDRIPQINICTEKKGDVVLLLVQDNGMGMNLDKWGHLLFQPFKRLNNHQKGTGIGLHLVKQIIEKNGGKIKVKSQPGVGSTFFCFLRPYNR